MSARRILVVVGLLGAGAPAWGATFCVNTQAEFQTALMTAASNGESDTIRVKVGTYTSSSGNVVAVSPGENFSLTIQGGWLTFLMLDCGLRSNDPTDTVIDGEGARRGMSLTPSGGTNGDLTIENLTFANGMGTESGGGLRIGGSAGYTGDIVIDRVYFNNNTAESFGGGLSGGSDGGLFTLRNSLFRGNNAGVNHGAASLTTNAASGTNYRAFVGGNTIVENGCTFRGCNAGGIRVGGNARWVVFNNAFGFNDGSDLILSGNTDLFNNNLLNMQGSPVSMSGNLSLSDPMFVNPAGVNFRLQFDSPLRNAGTGAFNLGTLDFAGFPRLNDGQFDIGAYENREVMLRDGFETIL